MCSTSTPRCLFASRCVTHCPWAFCASAGGPATLRSRSNWETAAGCQSNKESWFVTNSPKGTEKKNVVRDFPLEIHISELMRELEENKLKSLNIVIENTVFGRLFLNALLASVSWVNMNLSLDWNLVASLEIPVAFLQSNGDQSSCGVCLRASRTDGLGRAVTFKWEFVKKVFIRRPKPTPMKEGEFS